MLSTIEEDSKIDDVVFAIGNRTRDVTYYSCIGSNFANQSHVFRKLIKKNKKKRHKRKTREIHLKHMTEASFCFIRNSVYDLEPVLTYNVVVDVLYSAIKYELKALVKQCVSFLMDIESIDDYFTVIRSFSVYPKSLFKSFFVNTFSSKSQFIIHNIQHILSDDRFIRYSTLCTMHIFCEYIVSRKLISHQRCYQYIVQWCKHEFNTKFKPLVSIQQYWNNDNGEISVNGEQSDSSTWSVSHSVISFASTSDHEESITQWQDLFEDFISLIDFRQMDIEYLLVDIRSDHVMTHQDLLSILFQKYEYDKEVKMELMKEDDAVDTPPRDEARAVPIRTSVNMSTGIKTVSRQDCIFRTEDMYLKREQLDALTVGARIDLRDTFGRYLKAEIIEIKEANPNKMKIHYVGWNAMWDRWIDTECDAALITKYGNITDREIHKIQIQELDIGDKVMIKLPMYHKHAEFGWISADITNIDGGQLNVQYKLINNHEGDLENGTHEFWVHADNINECR